PPRPARARRSPGPSRCKRARRWRDRRPFGVMRRCGGAHTVAPMSAERKTAEHARLEDARTGTAAWKAWGPYLSERQWGTVREDYSGGGDAWNYFPHDHARSRAYRWGEDGIAGICDERQRMCLALALWNG